MGKFKINDVVEITRATGFKDSKVGDKATIYADDEYLSGGMAKLHKNGEKLHLGDWQAHVVFRPVAIPNRDFLRDFVKMNNIKTTRVSKALGKSQNWLTQMMNDKRRDMTDATLKSIMKQLHIDWASKEFLHVRSEVPYRTRPANYKTTQHKERLQRDFWNGMVTK